MIRILFIFLSFIIGIGNFGVAKGEDQPLPAPLPPKDIFYQAPSPDIPIEIASLLGKWEGDWPGGTNSFLIVEKVDLEKARIIYGWGTNPPRIKRRGFRRRIAKIRIYDGLTWLQFSGGRWEDFLFHLSRDLQTLKGHYRGIIEMEKTATPVFDRTGSLYVPPKQKTVAFVNVNVIPMDKNRVLASQTVIVQDGRIAQIGSMNQVKIPKSAEIVQGNGKAFLMPGLADMHVHIRDGNDLRLLIANGVTTVRNMGGDDRHLIFKEDVREGFRVGPMIYSAGWALDGDPPARPLNRVIRTKDDARRMVIETKEQGFDFIKVYSNLGPEAYAAIVETAKKHKIPVVGHVPMKVGFSSVVSAGQLSVEHLEGSNVAMTFMCLTCTRSRNWSAEFDENKLTDFIEKTVKAGLWNCPTLVRYKRSENDIEKLTQARELKYLPESRKDRWRIYIQPKEHKERRQYLVRRLHEAGAGLLLGTDMTGSYMVPGFTIHEELQRFVDSGLIPYEAIKTGTYNAAKFMKKLDQFGTVEKGKEADLILIRGNPLEDVANIKNPLGVMAKGRWYPEPVLEKMLRDIVKEVAERNQADARGN